MAAGDTSVQETATITAAGIKAALDAAITATSANANVFALQFNNGAVFIAAVEQA